MYYGCKCLNQSMQLCFEMGRERMAWVVATLNGRIVLKIGL
jgi:hypothetical protein